MIYQISEKYSGEGRQNAQNILQPQKCFHGIKLLYWCKIKILSSGIVAGGLLVIRKIKKFRLLHFLLLPVCLLFITFTSNSHASIGQQLAKKSSLLYSKLQEDPTLFKILQWINSEKVIGELPYCYKRTYERGIGTLPSQCTSSQEKIGPVCYNRCPNNYSRTAAGRVQNCRPGFKESMQELENSALNSETLTSQSDRSNAPVDTMMQELIVNDWTARKTN